MDLEACAKFWLFEYFPERANSRTFADDFQSLLSPKE
jgi:hypothetical protein